MTEGVPVLLIVEDDMVTREMLRMALEDEGFSVVPAPDVAAMRRVLAVDRIDAAVLDMSLPDGNALDALLDVDARARPPALCMSSDEAPALRVDALARGAEDFLLKPVTETELIARVRKMLGRCNGSAAAPAPEDGRRVIRLAGWSVEPDGGRVVGPDGLEPAVTAGEFRLLVALLRNPGRPLSREWLTETVMGRRWHAEDRSVDVMVGRLRRKMKLNGTSSLRIVAVRHLGYRVEADG